MKSFRSGTLFNAILIALFFSAHAMHSAADEPAVSVPNPPASAIVFFASQAGLPTFDQAEEGGNPFASALIELLARPSLSFLELRAEMNALTKLKSDGLQEPEIKVLAASGNTERQDLRDTAAKRVAFVFVFSDYSSKASLGTLPGAKNDLSRISQAFARAGFETVTALDPTHEELEKALRTFSLKTRQSDIAVIYTTGHGLEYMGKAYLIPNDSSPDLAPADLPRHAIGVESLLTHMQAKTANFVFYGGCRTICQ